MDYLFQPATQLDRWALALGTGAAHGWMEATLVGASNPSRNRGSHPGSDSERLNAKSGGPNQYIVLMVRRRPPRFPLTGSPLFG
jgi:hypothetical protein